MTFFVGSTINELFTFPCVLKHMPDPLCKMLHLQCVFFKVLTSDFLRNHASDRNSEGTLYSSTFDFVYWGSFSAPISNVFVQENFFLFLKRWFLGVVFWIMRLFQSQILRPLPWWKKLKPHVTVLSIIKVFFPVLIF